MDFEAFDKLLLTWLDNLVHRCTQFKRHVTKNSKDGKTGKQGGEAIDETNNKCVIKTIVVELVVRRQSNEPTPCRTEREKDLGGRVFPYLI